VNTLGDNGWFDIRVRTATDNWLVLILWELFLYRNFQV